MSRRHGLRSRLAAGVLLAAMLAGVIWTVVIVSTQGPDPDLQAKRDYAAMLQERKDQLDSYAHRLFGNSP